MNYRRLNGDGQPVYLKIMSPISLSRSTDTIPFEFVDATNLRTGEVCRVVADTVLRKELRAAYPNDGYINRDFEIRKFNPQGGKRYATFDIKEIRLNQPAGKTNLTPEPVEPVNDDEDESIVAFEWSISPDETSRLLGFTNYCEYRASALWRRIKRRIKERDNNLCRRCGGKARFVHHRSYAIEVMRGDEDEQLVCVCEGCHDTIHRDDSGNWRIKEECDRVLLEIDQRSDFRPFTIDRRRDRFKQIHPDEWPRMNAIQRAAWNDECNRQFDLWKVCKRESDFLMRGEPSKDNWETRTRRKMLKTHHGMDDASIDLAVAEFHRKRVRKRPPTAL